MKVPFVDLKAQYNSIKSEIDAAIAQVITTTAFISGSHAKAFEENFSQFIGTKHCIACGNGTDSLEILLQAMDIGQGDEVIVPACSWISTSEAVSAVGALPVFVDVDEHLLMDLQQVEQKITAKTKAVIPVHLYGNMVDMPALMRLAEKTGIKILEDCAQAHGAAIQEKKAGTFGHAASFSFYPGKNLGAYGDAGAMLTDDDDLARKARSIANHGQEGKHNHIMEGRNSRMDGIQAAILNVKLPHLEKWTTQRIRHAELYHRLITSPNVAKPVIREGIRHVFHLYAIRVPEREKFMAACAEKEIETAIHYPVALPFLPCYTSRGYSVQDFPHAAKAFAEVVSLPMYAEISDEQIAFVAQQVNEFFG